jgi:hypothetical protein
MPRGVYERTTYRGVQVKRHISKVRTEAILARWESVKKETEEWLKPFYDLPIERAMFYLEDLRKICEQAGHIMNERISGDKARMKCSGPRCGKNLEGTNPSGRPKWLAKKDLRDKDHPEIIRSLYFCSELCNNQWTRAQQGAMGGDGR